MHGFSADAVISLARKTAVTEKLIEIVKNYPILYDLANKDYKNVRKKDKIWEQIGLELDGNGDELKKKWKNLRDSYAKHLRSLKTTTGQSAQQKLYKWQWAKQMEAFRPFMSFAKTESNIKDITVTESTAGEIDMTTSPSPSSSLHQGEITSDVEGNIALQETETLSTASQTPILSLKDKGPPNYIKRKKKSTDQAQQESPTAEVIKYLSQKHKCNPHKRNMDAVDLIFSGYAKTIKMFSPRLQVSAKLRFAVLMSQLELEHQHEGVDSLASGPSTSCSLDVRIATTNKTPRFSSPCSETCNSSHSQGATSESLLSGYSFNANAYQVTPVGTKTSQQNSTFSNEHVPITPYFLDSQSRQSNEVNYQTKQNGSGSTVLTCFVNNYNPNDN